MQRLLTSLSVFMLMLASFAAQISGDGRATELIAQARAALGGESKLSKVQALSATGTYQREMGDRQMNGEITIDLQLPDKMLRTDSMNPMGDATIVVLQGINGDQLLRNSRTIGGGPGMMIRRQPSGRRRCPAQALRNQRADFARFTLAFLLTSPEAVPLEYCTAVKPKRTRASADVIDAKGPGSFAARLFLDKKTHRPLMPPIAARRHRGRADAARRRTAADPNRDARATPHPVTDPESSAAASCGYPDVPRRLQVGGRRDAAASHVAID
jgi:hypothetical protein